MSEKYLTSGEFANICKIDKHVLFHYDAIGLFKPALVKENGYRYYSYHQYYTFQVILVLKRLGMPLHEIKVYLENRSASLLLSLLDKKTQEVIQQIEKLKAIQDFIRQLQENTKEALEADKEVIHLVQLPASYLYISANLEDANHKDFAIFMQDYISFIKDHTPTPSEFVGVMISTQSLYRKQYSNYTYLYTEVKDISRQGRVKKEGFYLCTYHQGTYESIGQTYERMLTYANNQQIILGEYAYEEYLLSDIAQKDTDSFVTRIYIEVNSISS